MNYKSKVMMVLWLLVVPVVVFAQRSVESESNLFFDIITMPVVRLLAVWVALAATWFAFNSVISWKLLRYILFAVAAFILLPLLFQFWI